MSSRSGKHEKTPVGLVAVVDGGDRADGDVLVVTSARGETPLRLVGGRARGPTVASGLVNPWSLAFLPDGRMLVTERPGRMRLVTAEGQVSPPLKGVPEVWASGQGGLLDVVADKAFAQNKTIYFCYAERTDGGGRTAVARAKLNDGNGRLDDVKVIFRQDGPLSSGNHYRLPHRAGRRRQSVRHAGRPFHRPRRGAEPRQSSRQADPDRAGRLGAAGQPVRWPRRRQAGNLELRPPQPRRRSRSIRPPASSGKSSTARAAATRSTSSARARTTAGR